MAKEKKETKKVTVKNTAKKATTTQRSKPKKEGAVKEKELSVPSTRDGKPTKAKVRKRTVRKKAGAIKAPALEVAPIDRWEETVEDTTPHDEFDWEADNDSLSSYNQKEIDTLTKMYNDTFSVVNEKQIVKGKVVTVTDSDVVLNIGFKSDGLVSLSEFRDVEEYGRGV